MKIKKKSLISISWEKFKVFFYNSLRDSQAFVISYWTKIWQHSQYHLEEVLDKVTYLEHLQAVLKEFGPIVIPNKENLICYF